MIRQIHHVAILTSDIEAAIGHYVDLIGCQRRDPVDIQKHGLKWRSVLLPIGNQTTALQLIQPLEGPGVEELNARGEGALFEVGFVCEDADAFVENLRARVVAPSDLAEAAIDTNYIISKYGNRYFIVPRQKSRGTRLEFIQFEMP